MTELPLSDGSFQSTAAADLQEPVREIPTDEVKPSEPGTALCLSGGGYRAMLFHAGVIWRLNDLGILGELKRISSVSGGSITAGVLATRWNQLDFSKGSAPGFEELVITPIRRLAGRTIDIPSIILGLLWFGSVGNRIAARYRKYLFGDATLQDLPPHPRFIFNATSVQSGVLCRFSRPYIWDYRIGRIDFPKIAIADAVAASSAFPPVLSPLVLDLDPNDFVRGSGTDLERPEFQRRLVLTDGGVYDNLGLETAWKRYDTILVSDAGGGYRAEAKPKRDWIRHTARMLFTIDNQVRSLRRRQIVGSFTSNPPAKTGAFWSIASDYSDGFRVPSPLPCPFDRTTQLANVGTRLKKLDAECQMRLINWGYAACDFPIRRFLRPEAAPPVAFPYPQVRV